MAGMKKQIIDKIEQAAWDSETIRFRASKRNAFKQVLSLAYDAGKASQIAKGGSPMIELNSTPDTYIAGMMDAARIVRERKGKYTLEQTANYLEGLCISQSSNPNASNSLSQAMLVPRNPQTGDYDFEAEPICIDCGIATKRGRGSARCKACWNSRLGQ
jgi:hypothetical protein